MVSSSLCGDGTEIMFLSQRLFDVTKNPDVSQKAAGFDLSECCINQGDAHSENCVYVFESSLNLFTIIMFYPQCIFQSGLPKAIMQNPFVYCPSDSTLQFTLAVPVSSPHLRPLTMWL